jgi:hypothetical protein
MSTHPLLEDGIYVAKNSLPTPAKAYCIDGTMMRNLLLTLALLIPVNSYSQSQFGPTFMHVSAWTEHTQTTRYPSSGTYDVSQWHYIGGMMGIDFYGPHSRGTATFFWTTDAAGTQIVGVRSLPLTSAIFSTNQLRMLNLGPYLYIVYQPWFRDLIGPHRMAANLFGTNTGDAQSTQVPPGDNILIDERDRKLPFREAMYPAGYFGGEVLLYFNAPPGVEATLYGFDLEDVWWPLDAFKVSGTYRTIVPNGTWFIYVQNFTGSEIQYTLSVTPLFRGGKP